MMDFSRAVMLLVLCVSVSAHAASNREGRVDVSIGAIYSQAERENGSNGSSIDVDSEIGFAFSAAYNISPRLAVGFEGSYVRPDYSLVINTDLNGLQQIDHTLSVGTGMFNGIFYFTEKPLAPFIQAGLGWTYIDSNVTDGPPSTGCWWDFWWGYVCSNFYSTYSSTDFAYGVGAGVRYDMVGNMFVKGSYTYTWVDSGAKVDQTFGQFRLELGWRL